MTSCNWHRDPSPLPQTSFEKKKKNKTILKPMNENHFYYFKYIAKNSLKKSVEIINPMYFTHKLYIKADASS